VSLRAESLLLAACIAVAGAAAIAAGQDANWDLLNYHFYNPWAWLHGRYGDDIAPAGLQTFHNPLVDVPFYLLATADVPPRLVAFVLAIPAGIAAYAVHAIARLLFAPLEPPLARAAPIAALVVGMTGPIAQALVGTTMNEWTGTALLCVALLLVVRGLHLQALRPATLALAGLLAGAACGLKLTAAPYVLALAFALVATRGLRQGMREGAILAVAVTAGLAITLGPWMTKLYALTGNPLFPYFNALFGSPWLSPDWTFRQPFGPRSLGEWLTLPFDLLRPPRGYVSEQRYRDARFPLVATLALAALLVAAAARARGRAVPSSPLTGVPGAGDVLRFCGIYLVAGFVLWAAVFGIHRYLLALEVLTGIAIVALVVGLVPARVRLAAIVTLAALVVVTTRVPSWWRVPFGEHVVEVDAPPIAPGTLVLVQGAPLAWLLPSLGPQARYVGIRNHLVEPDRASGLRTLVAGVIDAQRGSIAVLRARGDDDAAALDAFGVSVAGPCREVRGNLARHPAELCPAARRP
jgi:hypothetical protein